jgi:hypothetical protein
MLDLLSEVNLRAIRSPVTKETNFLDALLFKEAKNLRFTFQVEDPNLTLAVNSQAELVAAKDILGLP